MTQKYTLLKMLSLTFVLGVMLTGNAVAQTLQQRVERLERMADNPVLLQQSQRINDQQREIQSLYDEVDRLTRLIQSFETKLAKQYQDMDERMSQLETRAKEVPASTSAAPATVVAPVVVATTTAAPSTSVSPVTTDDTAEQKRQYDAAFALMRDAKYDESIAAFEAFATKYPQAPLTSNAYYWMGEGYLIKQNFAKAYEAFDIVLKQYTNSNKIEDSMLRGADSLVGLNRMDEAKAMYEGLVKKYPTSRAAKSAERRLDRFKTGQ